MFSLYLYIRIQHTHVDCLLIEFKFLIPHLNKKEELKLKKKKIKQKQGLKKKKKTP